MKHFCASRSVVLLTLLVLLVTCGHSCPTDGDWSDFGDWSDCSAACGEGTQKRTRSCYNPAPANGGSNCVGDTEETKECNDQPCYSLTVMCDDETTVYVDGVEKYTDKLVQSVATLTVPSSTSVIAVKCHNRSGNYWIVAYMKDADGNNVMVSDKSWRCSGVKESGWEKPDFVEGDNWKQPIGLRGSGHIWSSGAKGDWTAYCRKILPTDGDWSDFGDWSDCSAACGEGTQRRTRSCYNPAPANGGSNCVGDTEETKECNDQPCYSLTVMCDDDTTVYVDGVEKYTDKLVQSVATLTVPSSTSVIAVKCHNRGGHYWIVAHMKDADGNNVMVSDKSWRCSGVMESGWEKPGFVEGDNWKQPISVSGTSYIWSSGAKGDWTAYCRKILN